MQIKNNYYCCHISIFYRHELSYSITTDIYWGPGGSFQLRCLIFSEEGSRGKAGWRNIYPLFPFSHSSLKSYSWPCRSLLMEPLNT